jgi:hypothetical protein
MNINIVKLTATLIAPVAMLVLTSCTSAPSGKRASAAAYQPGVPGGVRVQAIEETAIVTAVDAATRKVTLATSDGKKSTVKAGPEVVNFAQIAVGDQVKVAIVEELVVYLKAKGELSADGQASAIALAPLGAKPGGAIADTIQVTAKVTAIDLKNHRATLQFPDGSSRTVAVRDDVDLAKRSIGEEVVIRSTEAVAIRVVKP